MTNLKTYRGEFLNTEVTHPGNLSAQQLVVIQIFDTESEVFDNPFGFGYRTTNNYDGTFTVFLSWTAIPEAATDATFGYLDTTWQDATLDISKGSAVVVIPEGNWQYSIWVQYPGSDTRVILSNNPTIPLELTDTPLTISVIDNDEDKFTAIRSKQCEINIYSSDVMDIDNFCSGGDNRFAVEVDLPATGFALFRGFLSLSDLSQDFQPDPNVITLTATDGLGFLNDEPLVTFDGVNPQNEHPILTFIAWALALTGQPLDIEVIMNIRDEGGIPIYSDDSGDGQFYKRQYLDARTFEDEIGTSIVAYDVLERILGHMCYVTQYRGKWRVQRIDELEGGAMTCFRFDSRGNFIDKTTIDPIKQIGVDLPLSWMNDDAVKSPQRPNKTVDLYFDYEYPQELICNIDLSRGEGPETEVDFTGTVNYIPDCIEWLSNGDLSTIGDLDQPADPVTVGQLRKEYEGGEEQGRYLYGEINGAPQHYWKFSQLDVREGDKVTFGFSIRFGQDVTVSPVALVLLYGNDGSIWAWYFNTLSGEMEWVLKASGDPAFGTTWEFNNGILLPEGEYASISSQSKAIPVSGKLVFRLYSPFVSYITDLSISYLPRINGSYPRFTGQSNTVTQGLKTKALREEQVYISDAPVTVMKGAILKATVGGYALAGPYYDAARYPDPTEFHRYGWLQVFDVWNQFNRVMMQFEGVVDGLETTGEVPDIIHTYQLTDIDPSTEGRLFMVLHYEQNHWLQEFTLFLQEVYNQNHPKNYEGHTFQYTTKDE